MPEKPVTIATYAAGASLAAITLIYVFGPTFFLDDDSSSTKKKGVVGLSNVANDCFINSVLQALAGLPDLRIYLIRETHRRKLDGDHVYITDPDDVKAENGRMSAVRLEGLQRGWVTFSLKEILDNLNERPIHRKVISPQPFIRALERAFNTHISRQQQDAQEFLQIVMERLCDEYHAGIKARQRALKRGLAITRGDTESGRQEIAEQFGVVPPETSDEGKQDEANENEKEEEKPESEEQKDQEGEEEQVSLSEEGFPFEGKTESQIECLTCHFKPKPTTSTFVTLTLNVPQASSTSLSACLDGTFKVEHIEDFKCEHCRLDHAIQYKTRELARASGAQKERLQEDIDKLRAALETDPENPPSDVELPDSKLAPRRRIARHTYISSFPKVLAIHLSRSMFAMGSMSSKNMAKVAFPETLPLGTLLNHQRYRLLGVVTHKGSHNSGHYESFRRQVQPVPFSTPASFGSEGVYSRQNSPNPSAVCSPRMSTSNLAGGSSTEVLSLPPPALHSPSVASLSSSTSQGSRGPAATSSSREDGSTLASPTIPASAPSRPRNMRALKEKASSVADKHRERQKKAKSNRWWRISDDKIKESKTSEVLGMQKEVYLLFYELETR